MKAGDFLRMMPLPWQVAARILFEAMETFSLSVTCFRRDVGVRALRPIKMSVLAVCGVIWFNPDTYYYPYAFTPPLRPGALGTFALFGLFIVLAQWLKCAQERRKGLHRHSYDRGRSLFRWMKGLSEHTQCATVEPIFWFGLGWYLYEDGTQLLGLWLCCAGVSLAFIERYLANQAHERELDILDGTVDAIAVDTLVKGSTPIYKDEAEKKVVAFPNQVETGASGLQKLLGKRRGKTKR